MGQQNEKVVFEGHRQTNQKRKNIFGRSKKDQQPLEICQIPGCKCHLPHPQFNTKICSNCQESPPPFLKTKSKPIYYQQSYYLQQPKNIVQSQSKHLQEDEAERIPTKLNYFNAWSLPTQKYHIRQKSGFNLSLKKDQSQISGKEQNIDNILNQVTHKILQVVDPKIEFDRRKQNMNLTD